MLSGIMSAVGTLVFVIGILYLTYVCTRYIGKRGKIRGSSRYIRLVDQIVVGQDRTIAVIQTGQNYLLLGITPAKITVLKELEESDLKEIEPKDGQDQDTDVPSFQSILEKIGRKKRGE